MSERDQRDDLVFAAEADVAAVPQKRAPWKLLIVDDEEEVHSITRMVLDGFSFEDAGLEFLSAYSAAEARRILKETPDIAVILLDVVMETPHAGLDLARFVRETLHNSLVRIILRTGQPGQAPERQVIVDYDINDYKSKAELTAQKLFTTVTTGLRSYRDIRVISRSREGLEDIIAASAGLFQTTNVELFARGVLTQMTSLLRLEDSSMYLGDASGFTARDHSDDYIILAGTGVFAGQESRLASEVLTAKELLFVRDAAGSGECLFRERAYAGCFGAGGARHLLFLRVNRDLTTLERNLVRIFAANVGVAFENLLLNQEIAETHREVIFTLGEIVENRGQVESQHVQRVADMGRLLGEKVGLLPEDCDLMQLAMPLHDVGKVAIPDRILLKEDDLTDEELQIVRQHPMLGYDILHRTDNPIMQTAAIIAREHQEAWDGSGYPKGLKGGAIHIFSRIARVVDVFDALLSQRVYKDAWTEEDALAYLEEQRGRLFDPFLVDVLVRNKEEFLALRAHIDTTADTPGD